MGGVRSFDDLVALTALIRPSALQNNFIHPLIWSKWFKNRLYSWSSDLWIHAIACIVIVIVVCTVMDQIRIYWIERPILEVLRKKHIWERVEQRLLSWQKEE